MRYSKQRDEILKYVQSSLEHPTAEMVYHRVKTLIPDISLGTVYRNLAKLCQTGEIVKITTPNDSDRYDKITHSHSHIICSKCHTVYDVFIDEIENISKIVSNKTGHHIMCHEIAFYGICKECAKLKGDR